MNSLLFVDDAVMITDSEECVQRMANKMGVSGSWEKAKG